MTSARWFLLLLLAAVTGCRSKPPAPAVSAPPAKVDNRVKESDLTQVTLTAEAERRLGLTVEAAAETVDAGSATIAGEVLLVPGKVLTATAPVAGAVRLTRRDLSVGQTVRKGEPLFRLTPLLGPQRDLLITYEADLQAAKARRDAAGQQLARAQQLLKDLAGSQRNVETAQQEWAQADAAYAAAAARLDRLKKSPLDADVDLVIEAPAGGVVRQMAVTEAQTVSSGVVLVEVVDAGRVWLRVPVYAGDVDWLEGQRQVTVRNLDGAGPVRQGVKVAAPPSADPLAATADLYFEMANADGQLRPGQRLSVQLPARRGAGKAVGVPAGAVLYDVHGGAWVYVSAGAHTYRRQRVELLRMQGGRALLARGITPGTPVVASGAAELFGTEFGAGK